MVLYGWKEIAHYMGCGIRTAQRRQREGLPVKRITEGPRAHVIALSDEIDMWLRNVHSTSAVPVGVLNDIQRTRALRFKLRREAETLRFRMRALRQGLATFRVKKNVNTQLLADTIAAPQLQGRLQPANSPVRPPGVHIQSLETNGKSTSTGPHSRQVAVGLNRIVK